MSYKSFQLVIRDCTNWSAEARKAEDPIVCFLAKTFIRDGSPPEGATADQIIETTGVEYDFGRKRFNINGIAPLVDYIAGINTDLRVVVVPANGVQYLLRPVTVDDSMLVAAARHKTTKFKARLELRTLTAEFPPTRENADRAEDVGRNVCAILGFRMLRMNRAKATDTGRPLPFYYIDMDLIDDTNGFNIQALQREDVQNPAFPSGSHARFQLDEALCKDEDICKKCYRQLGICKCSKRRQAEKDVSQTKRQKRNDAMDAMDRMN